MQMGVRHWPDPGSCSLMACTRLELGVPEARFKPLRDAAFPDEPSMNEAIRFGSGVQGYAITTSRRHAWGVARPDSQHA